MAESTSVRQKILLGLCCAIGFIAGVEVAIYEAGDLKGIMLNLFTEILGLLIVVWIIDGLVDTYKRKETSRLRAVAVLTLEQPLRRYMRAWLVVAHGDDESARSALAGQPLQTYLISDGFITALRSRSMNDGYGPATIIGPAEMMRIRFPKIVWYFREGVMETLRVYAHSLETDFILILQHFWTGAHLYNIIRFWEGVDIGTNHWFQRVEPDQMKDHFSRVLMLLERYNAAVEASHSITSENVMELRKLTGSLPNAEW